MNYLDQAQKLYKDKNVLILGLGINQGGLGATKFFAKAGSHVKVTDLKTEEDLQTSLDELKVFSNITYTLGEHKLEDIDWADIVIRNPGVRPDNKFLLYALEKGKQVEMDLGIFTKFVSLKQIIGVTGTKGKSTTASLIYEVLKDDPGVLLAGNIGKSVFDLLEIVDENSIVILELSSFQLQAFEQHKISPHISVITNIYEDHLNYHGTMEEYIKAKKAIASYQTDLDYLYISTIDEVTSSDEFKKGIQSKVVYFSSSDLPADFQPLLPGEHNLVNMAAAFKIAEQFGIDKQLVLERLKNFTGVEFRLQLIKETNGIKIYNDSAATNPSATIEAIKSLPNSILIAGGVNKDLSYLELAHSIDDNVKALFFIEGDATEELRVHIKEQDKIMGTYSNLEELMIDVMDYADNGDTILFSPGAASFNLFQNEFDRGRKFNHSVEKITK
jgi:UDP-N-acetylmuramoylalanine--D-glutamate ligase